MLNIYNTQHLSSFLASNFYNLPILNPLSSTSITKELRIAQSINFGIKCPYDVVCPNGKWTLLHSGQPIDPPYIVVSLWLNCIQPSMHPISQSKFSFFNESERQHSRYISQIEHHSKHLCHKIWNHEFSHVWIITSKITIVSQLFYSLKLSNLVNLNQYSHFFDETLSSISSLRAFH